MVPVALEITAALARVTFPVPEPAFLKIFVPEVEDPVVPVKV